MKKFAGIGVFLLLLTPFFGSIAYGETKVPPQKGEAVDDDDLGIGEQMKLERKKKEENKKIEIPPIKMVYVKGGCFEMGDFTGEGDEDEFPAHRVCLIDFMLGETEVTQELYESVMEENPSRVKDPQKPVTNVSWGEAYDFINKLNSIKKTYYRLPTEAEWEYAARNRGKNDKWSGINNEGELSAYSWFADNSTEEIKLVKQKMPNALGIYDMSGNVWEWVEDFFDFDFYKKSPERNPDGPATAPMRGLRGGSAVDDSYKLRTTFRYAYEPVNKNGNIGFRLAE